MRLIRMADKAWNSLRSDGVMPTLRRLLRYPYSIHRLRVERGFDRRYGTDTLGIREYEEETDVVGQNLTASFGYEGIQVPVFRDIVDHLPIRPQDCTFLDFGSGKGRALMMAAECGFRRVVGVEFSRALHDIACRNVELFRRTAATAAPIELHCDDAARFELPHEDMVCFFYNPFDCTVMQHVVANIQRVCQDSSVRTLVAYRNPVCAHVLDAAGFVRLHYACRTHRIYDSRAVPQS